MNIKQDEKSTFLYILYIARSNYTFCLVFYVQKVSITLNLDNSVTWSPFEVPLARLLVFEIYPVTDLEGGWLPVHSLLCSFKVIFIQHLSLDLPKIIACAPEAGEEVNLDLFHKLRRMEILLWLHLVLVYNWQEPDWCICPSWMGPSRITSSGWVSDTYGKLLTFHCSVDGKVLKIFFQFLIASVLGP